jgi:hypothetical protein
MNAWIHEKTGNILMRRVFTEPTKPEELYAFFTYGLALNPLNWRCNHWYPNATINSIKRRLWNIDTTLHSQTITVEYQAGIRDSDSYWFIHESRYL